jgi:hypothetical protein
MNESQLRDVFLGLVKVQGWRLAVPAPGIPDVATLAARRLVRGAGQVGFGNARAMKVFFEGALRNANSRMIATRAAGLTCANDELTKADVLGEPLDPDRSAALKELFALPGLERVKDEVCVLEPLPPSPLKFPNRFCSILPIKR